MADHDDIGILRAKIEDLERRNADLLRVAQGQALPAVTVGVKPLVFAPQTYQHDMGEWVEPTAGDYRIADGRPFRRGGFFVVRCETEISGPHQTEAEAVSAAQADNEARILAAQVVREVAPSEARRAAAQLLWDMLHRENGADHGMTLKEVQALWDAAKDQQGYAAVSEFLAALRGVKP